MANGFTLDSEKLQQSPQQQQLAAQQPAPAQAQGGGFNLLDVLGGLGDVIAETGAYYAASQGRPQLLEAMQKRKEQQNLLNQLQSFAKQADPEVQTLISNQLQFGQQDEALKTAANASTFKLFKEGLKTSRLSSDLKSTLSSIYLTNPDKAVDMLRSLEIAESQLGTAKQKSELRKKEKESEAPIGIIVDAFEKNLLKGDEADLEDRIISLLVGQKIKVTPDMAKQIILNPKLAPYLKAQPAGFFERMMTKLFGSKPQQPAPAATTAPAVPAAPASAPAPKMQTYNPATGLLE